MYYDITAYDWFQGKREDFDDAEQIEQTVRLRNVSMMDGIYQGKNDDDDDDDDELEDVDIDNSSPVVVKLIPAKQKTVKNQKVRIQNRRKVPEVVDDSQDRINAFFDKLFPMKRGESCSDFHGNQLFWIDDASQTGNGSVKCKICLEEFVSALKLKAHLIVHKNLMYKCQYCPLEVRGYSQYISTSNGYNGNDFLAGEQRIWHAIPYANSSRRAQQI